MGAGTISGIIYKLLMYVRAGASARRFAFLKGLIMTRFKPGDRVRISDGFFWAKNARDDFGASRGGDHQWRMGCRADSSREKRTGENTVYWVWFDEPQLDADGDGPYRGGCIWETAMELV